MIKKIINSKILRVANIIWVPVSLLVLFLISSNIYSVLSTILLYALIIFETLLISIGNKMQTLTKPKLAIMLICVLGCTIITIFCFFTLMVNAGLDGLIELSFFIVLMTLGVMIVFSNDIDMHKK